MGDILRFPASLDNLARIISTVTALGILFALNTLYANRDRLGVWSWTVACLVFGLFVVGWLFRTTGYAITEDELVIDRAIGPRRLALHDIEFAKRVSSSDMGSQMRVFGSGGFGGYYGVYSSSAFKNSIDYYATNLSNLVLIKPRTSRELLISPDDPASFETALRARLSAASEE
ncbi:PH domain-containing protein [Methylosinus sp. Sm6]|uniref:PH domain-containing protein n=1 Tax=Methylosinus sp. Sm6 TaxID=2866948 RepID=UPI001C98E941|nr:PH domain-containing protein [Methylosinus sp. Sm6]MBY6243146.1 hypothetical protein [Methylosinus sp. Sm6]